MRKTAIWGIMLLVIPLATGCLEKAKEAEVSKTQNPKSEKDRIIVAKVNNEDITLASLNKQAMQLSSMYGEYFTQPEGKLEVLEQMISDAVLMQEVKNKGLEKDAKVITEIQEYQKQAEEQVQKYKDHLLKNKLLESVLPPPREISDSEAEKYFKEHKGEFSESPKAWARHILVKNKEEADKIIAKLDKGGDFAKLAQEHSLETSSASNGGSLGAIEKGLLYPEMEEAIFNLSVGKIKGIELKTGYYKGYYSIIKLDKKEEAKEHSFADIKDKVKEKIVQQEVRDGYQNYIKELKKRIPVVSYPEKVTEAVATSVHPPMGGKPVEANSVPDDEMHRDFSKEKPSAEKETP